VAPVGGHTVYLACPAAPGAVAGGWDAAREVLAERALDVVERHAPGFRASVRGFSVFTPLDMERAERWPLGHPMYLDLTLDQAWPAPPHAPSWPSPHAHPWPVSLRRGNEPGGRHRRHAGDAGRAGAAAGYGMMGDYRLWR